MMQVNEISVTPHSTEATHSIVPATK